MLPTIRTKSKKNIGKNQMLRVKKKVYCNKIEMVAILNQSLSLINT